VVSHPLSARLVAASRKCLTSLPDFGACLILASLFLEMFETVAHFQLGLYKVM